MEVTKICGLIFRLNLTAVYDAHYFSNNDCRKFINLIISSEQESEIKERTISFSDDLLNSFNDGFSKMSADSEAFVYFDLLDPSIGPGNRTKLLSNFYRSLVRQSLKCRLIAILLPNFKKVALINETISLIEDYCKSNQIAFILLSNDKPDVVDIRNPSNFTDLDKPYLKLIKDSDQKTDQFPVNNYIEKIDFLFGHFEFQIKSNRFHSSVVFNFSRLITDETFVRFIKEKIIGKFNKKAFCIYCFGTTEVQLMSLAAKIAEQSQGRPITDLTEIKSNESLVILVDTLSDNNGCLAKIEAIRKQIPEERIYVIGLTELAKFAAPQGIDCFVLHKTSFQDFGSQCKFCDQEVPIIEGENYYVLKPRLKKFDPYTFWEFLKLDKRFYRVEHKKFDRTHYHYNFIIPYDKIPIFKIYGRNIIIRIKNMLEEKGILPYFIQKIVAPAPASQDKEGRDDIQILVDLLAAELGLTQKDIIRIPRDYLISAQRNFIGKPLERYLHDNYGDGALADKNVIIFDQAIHFFKTLTWSTAVCEYRDDDRFKFPAKVLAIATFINRTDPAIFKKFFSESDHAPHFVSLYDWSIYPVEETDCFCLNENKA